MSCWKSLNNIVTIEPYMVLFFFVRVFNGTAFQELLYQKLCQQNYHYNVSECTNSTFGKSHQDLQGTTSTWVMYSNIATTAPAILTIIFMSGYSDKHGVRLVIFVPAISSIIAGLWNILNAYYMSWPIELSLISSFVTGCSGYYASALMAVTSYIVRDCQTSAISLGTRIGLMEFSINVGATVAALVVGPVMQYTGVIYVFVINFGISVLVLLDITLRLREPRGGYFKAVSDATFKEKLKDLFSFKAARKYIKVLVRKRDNSMRSHFHLMTIVFVFGFCSEMAVTDVLYIYVTKTLGYSELYYSMLYGIGGAMAAAGCTLGLYILTRVLRCEAITIGVLGLLIVSTSSGFHAYGDHQWCLIIGTALRFPTQYIAVCLRIYASKAVEEAELSSVLGYVASVQCLSNLFATLMFNGLYSVVLPYWPGWIYMIGAFMSLLVIPLATFVQRTDRANGVRF